jgi:branched-chain amino acid transport system permease protein
VQEAISYINQILIFITFGVAINLVLGYTGILHTGPAAFGAVTGYTMVYLTSSHGWPFAAAILLGVVFAAALGLLLGIPILRLEPLWVILLTLAVQLVVVGLATGLEVLGGSYGLTVDRELKIFGHTLFTPPSVLPVAAVCAVVVFAIGYRLGQSPYGRVLRGIREDDVASRALGKNVFFYKLSIFTITAGMAGLAGGLLSTSIQLATPGIFGFDSSVQIIAIVVIGGVGNLWGTVLGATLVVLLTPFFQNVIKLDDTVASLAQLVAYGAAMTIVVCFRPAGLVPEGASVRRLVARFSGPRPALAGVDGLITPGETVNEPGGSRATVSSWRRDIVVPEGASDVIVDVRDVAKSFAGIRAVDGLSMQLARGKISALVGPNGAGKTTVFNLLTGALAMDSGTVHLNGQDITGLRPDLVARLGMVRSFQDVRAFNGMTVLENVIFGVPDQPGERLASLFSRPMSTRSQERAAREWAMECLEFVGMGAVAQERCSSLGYGQQKLVTLARLLATDADVLLLDEPASGIDHSSLDEILELILRLRDAGRTVCIVEHSLDVVRRLADHIFFMELGRITAEGDFDELTADERLAEAYFGAV